MEGGAARCQKCAQMSDELTRNLREKADDKQEIRKLDKLVSELRAQVAKAEGMAQLARTSLTEKDTALAAKDANIAELESTLQMMMEECAGRSIELDQLRPKVKELHAENQSLVSQLLALKESMAERYNEINAIQEEAERMRRSAELMAVANSLPAPSSSPLLPAGADSEMPSGRIDPSLQALSFGCQLPSKARQTVVAHERNEIHSLAHNCSGAMVLTGSDDRTIKLWDSRNGLGFSV
jgi:hypothetical protein